MSPFYPPRARWWSGILRPWFCFHRALHLERIHCPIGFNAGQTFVSLLVPGFSFIALGRRMLGFYVMGIYLVSLPVYLIRLGFPEANFAYGLMLAAHATSVFYLFAHRLGEMEFFNKLLLAIACLFVVWLALYFPVVNFVERHYAVPLSLHGRVVLMYPRIEPAQLSHGDRVLFNFRGGEIGQTHGGGGMVLVESGLGWGPVLGLPGDKIVFAASRFSVNGEWQTNLPYMPSHGEFLVPTNRWFVWPEFGINSHGNVSEDNISALIQRLSIVSATQMTGRPYRTWFGRKQILP